MKTKAQVAYQESKFQLRIQERYKEPISRISASDYSVSLTGIKAVLCT